MVGAKAEELSKEGVCFSPDFAHFCILVSCHGAFFFSFLKNVNMGVELSLVGVESWQVHVGYRLYREK